MTFFRNSLTAKDKAISRSMRILMEDHLYWIIMVERYVHHEARHLKDLVRKLNSNDSIHSVIFERYRRMAAKKMATQTNCQGLGRHSKGDLQRMGIEDLQAVSSFLGSKTYILGGDKPSDLDAVLFGFMCLILYSSPQDSVFKTLVEKRLTNLFQHTKLMKSKFFADWDKLIESPDLPVFEEEVKAPEDTKESEKQEPKTEEIKVENKTVVPTTASSTTTATTTTAALPPTSDKVRTPARKVSDKPTPATTTSPARKMSVERVQTPVKKSVNGSSDKKENNDPDQPAKPRPTTLNPAHSPAVKRAAAAAGPIKPAVSAAKHSAENSKPASATATATTPKSPLSPVSPIGTTPKTSLGNSSSRKSSITSSTPSNKAKQAITNGASNVLKSMLGRKK